MIIHRYNEAIEERDWQAYLVRYGNMDKKTFKQYQSTRFKKKERKHFSKKSAAELLSRAEGIIERFEKAKNNGKDTRRVNALVSKILSSGGDKNRTV